MIREEAIKTLRELWRETNDSWYENVYNMAIESLQTEPIRCEECKHQDECEEVVLFEINDEEVMGHRLHWCSYAERREL